MAKKPLRDRQKNILGFIKKFHDKNGYPPTIREIGEKTNITSTSVVTYNLDRLEEQGYIERDRNVSRGVRLANLLSDKTDVLVASVENILKIPKIGRIAAGELMPVPGSDFATFDPEDMIDVAQSLLPTKDSTDLFALEVKGESMIDAMVNDGDIIILKHVKDNTARNGEMVAVFMTDRDETTLKYFFREGNRIRLQPANPNPDYKPIYFDSPSSLQIQGKVVMVIRQVSNRVN